jgi:hypothetical protein
MAEAIGLAVGVLGLAGLFSSCLACFDYVDSARSYERDSEILIGKILMQRVRLSLWGDLVGLNGHTDEIFESFRQTPAQEAGVRMCLSQLEKLLTSVQKLVNDHSAIVVEEACSPSQALVQPESRVSRLKRGLGINRGLASTDAISITLKKRVIWALRDKARITSLVEDIKDFVDGLHQMIPALQPRHNRLVQRSINLVTDVDALELVCELTVDDYPGRCRLCIPLSG